jgi:hypothetical protein
LPSRSHFLISGTTSDAVADGIIPSQSENRIVQAAKITLGQEMLSLSGIELTTVNGQRIAGLKRRVTANTDDYKKIYEFTLPSGNSGFVIPANETLHLIARAIIHDPEYGGASNQLLDIRSFSITTYGTASRTNFTTILPTPFPQHQTALGSISITTNAVSSAAAQAQESLFFPHQYKASPQAVGLYRSRHLLSRWTPPMCLRRIGVFAAATTFTTVSQQARLTSCASIHRHH